MTQPTLKEKQEHRKTINKLTPATKTDMIISLQNTITELRDQVDALLELKDTQIHTVNDLRMLNQTLQGKLKDERAMSSSMKSAMIATQQKLIQCLENDLDAILQGDSNE